MKRILMTLYVLAVAAATLVAQPRFSSHTEMLNFGQIEWKHPVTAQFIITNTGDSPLVLTAVEPDCACTATHWTQTPIAPGGKGAIDVTFDAEALGTFRKSVAVYTNATPHLVYLNFGGEVVTEIRDFTRTHPYLIGQIRVDKNSLDFPDVQQGEHPVIHIGVVNLSDRVYEPTLMHLPPYLQAEAKPAVLQKGEKGVISLTLNSDNLGDLGLTQTSVYLARFAGDKVGEDNELPVSAILLPDFSGMTDAERTNAPAISLSAGEVDIKGELARKSKVHRDITVTNTGRSPLQISKLQVSHRALGVSLKKSVLQPGETTRLRVTVLKKNLSKRHRPLRLLMITNDPMRAKVEINVIDN